MMRFAILGSVEVWAGERRVGVSGPRQLGLVSFLLLHRNRMVSRDALMDALWGEDAGIGDKRLQMAIARLRKQLEPPDGEGERRLRTISGGYLLAVEPGELDADAFADLVTDGRAALDAGDPGLASRILGQALALWRGPPLPEVAFADFAQPEIRRLEELRLSTFELLIDAEMQLGHHAAVIAEVEEELAGDPTREALVGRLMLALYRAGRQTDALAVYQRTRLHLDQELGLEPSEELKALQVQILEHAPSLEPDRLGTAGVTRRPVLPAGTVTLVFTDVEGSTRLLGELGSERYAGELRSHHELVREVVTAHGGVEVKSEGDGFFLAFARASDALEAAEALQAGSVGRRMRARVGIHTGEPLLIDGDYVGMDVHKAARISDAAHGGQVVVSQATRDLAGDDGLCELGEYRLKDLTAPERLFQLGTTQFPELRSLNRLNLPVPTSPIVGRREETAAALELLARADVRLVTLLGPGGSGKTRLAVEVAAQAVARYRDGVWMVLLASIRDGSLLTGEIARVLEIEPVAGERAEQTLVSALAERELLLVLDNTEHLPQTGALVAALLAAAPRVDVLCTSREPLRIRAEQRMDVGPLRREDASELFVARALAVRPDLKLDDRDRAAIGRICSRLDDLPLALELAAARIAAFKPTALEARLAERLSLPVAIEDLPARQQTLRATIDWSYRLLNPEEREMLESLAPFIGGVRLDTAESVWGPHALDLVLSLAEKSLLRRREDSDGETRLWMLETVREFVSEQSAAHASVDANADRHAAYFCELAAEAAPSMTTSDQARWLDRLNDEQPNLRAAMDRYMLVAPERALAMAASQIWFWEIRGYMHESRERLSAVLESTHGDSGDRAVALFGAGRMAALLGDPTAAEQSLGESARIARAVGNTGLAALALSNLVWAYLLLGDDQRGAASAAEAATLARSSGDPWVLATVLNNEGDTFAARGEFERARPLLEESLAIRRGIGDPRVLALSAANLAPLLLGAGELDAAEAILTEGLAHARAIAHGPLTLSLLSTAALAALQRNDLARTHEGLAAASEEISPDTDAESGAIFLSAAAALAASRNDPHTAATLWAATDVALHDAARVEVPAAAALRAELLPHVRAAAVDRWDDAWSAGTRLTLHAALGYATRSLTGTPSASGPLT